MFKMVALARRRPGMSMSEFIDYHQTTHSKIGEKYLTGNCIKYIRRFLHPLLNPVTSEIESGGYDLIMEMWFEDRQQWEDAMKRFYAPDVAPLVIADEEMLFDRSSIKTYTVEEYESDVLSTQAGL